MALWKEPSTTKPSFPPAADPAPAARFDATPAPQPMEAAVVPVTQPSRAKAESLIAAELTIEGKIEGTGHVRIAGRFKGDVDVRGDLTIESGAQVTGSIRADRVSIAGELVGNIETATHVDLMQSGALTGDLKAATATVAAGARMRGMADFGWETSGKSGRNGADHKHS